MLTAGEPSIISTQIFQKLSSSSSYTCILTTRSTSAWRPCCRKGRCRSRWLIIILWRGETGECRTDGVSGSKGWEKKINVKIKRVNATRYNVPLNPPSPPPSPLFLVLRRSLLFSTFVYDVQTHPTGAPLETVITYCAGSERASVLSQYDIF